MFSSNTSQTSGGYEIQRSLRFNSADSAFLERTFPSAGNRKTWTWSGWVKRVNSGTVQQLLRTNETPITLLRFEAADQLYFYSVGVNAELRTTAVYRDFSAWYHVVWTIDTTQATASDRLKLYVNGVQVTSFSTATYPSQNTDLGLNTASLHAIGASKSTGAPASEYANGYMTEINFIDGQALTPSSFGAFDAQTGVWGPTPYAGSYGTNGFYLNFSDNSNTTAATLGKDYSGNSNNWTPNNFSVSAGAGNDSLVDVPTNWGTDTGVGGTVRGNYCTLNPIDNGGLTLANGNLQFDKAATGWKSTRSTFGMATGKWYWESTITAATGEHYCQLGVALSSADITSYFSTTTAGFAYESDALKINGSFTSYGASYGVNDVIGVAFDADAGTLTFYKNGTSQGTAFSGMAANTYFPAVGLWGTVTANINFGQRPFAYTAPSGFKALNTQNLPTPTIGATTATQAGKFFNPVTYTGNNTTQSITGVGFQPDLVWVKSRSSTTNHVLIDVLRGVSRWLGSNDTSAEFNSPGDFVTAFNSDGFSVGPLGGVNSGSTTYVGWNWKANGAGVTNTAGSITSTVSANTTSGFSVVTCTTQSSGTGTAGHGLGAAPAMIIVKQRANTSDWNVYHRSIGSGGAVRLNTTQSTLTSSAFWNDTAPTSTVFTFGSGYGSSVSVVAYCFSEIPGYSRFGSFVGNGSADGPFVFCGFRPRYILFKTTASLDQPWGVVDTTRSPSNLANLNISPTFSSAENSGYAKMDILSNGFKIRETDNFLNNNGSTYIFAAFAESPFKYALAR